MNFAVSGMLWQMSLVMVDKETHSLWSHLLGEAMRGPLQGRTLEMLPSVITDWASWSSSHPTTTCVIFPRTAHVYRRQLHSDANDLLIGIARGQVAKAWKLGDLRKPVLVNDSFDGKPVVVVFEASSGTAAIHGRNVDGVEYQFVWREDKLFDLQTNSQWDLITGEAVAGPMKGKRLPGCRAINSLPHAWFAFHPESETWIP